MTPAQMLSDPYGQLLFAPCLTGRCGIAVLLLVALLATIGSHMPDV